MNIYEGKLLGTSLRIAIIVSRFNEFLTSKLLSGAQDCLTRHSVSDSDIDVYWAPGAFEIPIIAKKAALAQKYDGIICLGAVIRGDTPHFDYVAAEVSKGIASVMLEGMIPISFGVITTENIEQAIERSGTKSGNKGWDAALSLIEMVNLFKNI